MIETLGYAYMQRAMVAGVLIGAVCAIIGVYVVLKQLSFIGAGIAHASFGGVALGVWAGINPIWSAIVYSLAATWCIGVVSRRKIVREDTAIGVFFASSMALGVLIIGLTRSYQVDLLSYLFGSILAVTRADMWTTIGLAVLVLGCVGVFYKDLVFTTFDPEMAQVTGLPASKLYFLLITLMALTVVMSIKVVGIVLVAALLVIPAAAAFQLTERFKTMMALSVVFGVGSTIAGLLISAWLDIASGAAIVLLATIIFFICALFSPRRRQKTMSAQEPEQSPTPEVATSSQDSC